MVSLHIKMNIRYIRYYVQYAGYYSNKPEIDEAGDATTS